MRKCLENSPLLVSFLKLSKSFPNIPGGSDLGTDSWEPREIDVCGLLDTAPLRHKRLQMRVESYPTGKWGPKHAGVAGQERKPQKIAPPPSRRPFCGWKSRGWLKHYEPGSRRRTPSGLGGSGHRLRFLFTLRRFGPRTLNPGGQRAGWHTLCSSGPRRQRRIVWDSRNLGQTGCSRSRGPDTGSLPLCRLPDDVYLDAVPGGTCYLGRAAKLEGLRWIFLQPGLRGPSRHVPRDRAHRPEVARTCVNPVPSHPATGGRAASSGWGGCGRGLVSSSLSEPAAGRSPGNPRTASAAERSGCSSLRSGGTPVLAPLSKQSWKVAQTLLTLFTKEERGLKRETPNAGSHPASLGLLRVFVLVDGVCQFRDKKKNLSKTHGPVYVS